MARLQVSNDGISASYTLESNPSFYDPRDYNDIVEYFDNTGELITFKKSKSQYSNEIRILRWSGYEVNSPFIATVESYFRSIEGQIKYFNFNDFEAMNDRWSDGTTWKKARVIAVKTVPRKGSKLRFESLEVILQPE